MKLKKTLVASAIPILVLIGSGGASANLLEDHMSYYSAGVAYEKQGNFKGAYTSFQKALGLKPQDSTTLIKLAHVLNNDFNDVTRKGSLELAVQYLEKAEVYSPQDAVVKLLMAQTYENMGNHAEAIKHYERAIALEPDNVLIKMNLGLVHFENKNFKESIELLNKVILAYPDNLRARSFLGAALQSTDNYLAAIEQYNYVLNYEKQNFSIVKNIGDSWLALEQLDRAKENYEKARQIDPNVPDIHADIAFIEHKSKNFGDAVDNYNKALGLKPENEKWRRGLAYALWSDEKVDDAVKEFSGIGEHSLAGFLYQKLGENDKAIEYYLKAVEAKPEDLNSRFNLGRLYHEQKQFDLAKDQYLKIIELRPNDTEAIFLLGVAEQENGALSEAVKYYDELLKKHEIIAKADEEKKNFDESIVKNIYFNLGLAYKIQNKLVEAEKNFDKALANDFSPKQDVYKELISVKILLGKSKEAESILLDWLKKEPTNFLARNLYADLLISRNNEREAIEQLKLAAVLDQSVNSRLKLANLLQSQNNLYESLAEYQLVIDKEPKNLNALLGVANNYRSLNLSDESINAYKKAVDAYPEDLLANYNYGLALQAAERTEEALAQYKKVYELDADFVDNYYTLGLAYWDMKEKDMAVTLWDQFINKSSNEDLKSRVTKLVNEYKIGLSKPVEKPSPAETIIEEQKLEEPSESKEKEESEVNNFYNYSINEQTT